MQGEVKKRLQVQGQNRALRPDKTIQPTDQSPVHKVELDPDESVQQFKRLINQLPIGFFRSTPDGKVIAANRAMCRIAGYDSEQEILGIPAGEFYMDPGNREQLIRQLDLGMEIKDLEFQFKQKDGTMQWIGLNVYKVLDKSGNFVYLEGMAQDITSRKLIEEALRASEAHYRLLAENVFDAVWATGPDFKFNFFSPSVEFLTGYRIGDLLGQPMTAFLTPDSKKVADEAHAKALAIWVREPGSLLKLKPLELEVRRRDGTTFWAECLASIVHDGQGGILGLTGVTRDITARRRSEEALLESEGRYAAIAAHIPGVVFQFLRHRDGSFVVPYVSQKAGEIIGLEPERIVADVWSVFRLIPAEDLKQVFKAIEESARTMTDYRMDHRIVRPDGTTVWLRAQGTPNAAPNGEVTWNAVAIDVTDSKASDERFRAAHTELEQRVRERTADLKRLTSALEVLLEHREEEIRKLETQAAENYHLLVKPYVDRLRNSYLDADQEELVLLLEKNFNQIFAPLERRMSSELAALTPTEIQVAHLIRDGKKTKEISKLLNSSLATVSFHRHNIRTKLGLVGHTQNLRTYLENVIRR
jgi:PAS domain S-box-containing protein